MIRERSELGAIASEIHASGQPIALDLETYGTSEDKKIRKGETLDPWRGEIRLLSLQLPDRVPWLIDLRATGYGLGELGKALEATEVIGHNIKFDALWLARKCNVHLVKMVDTSSASRILSNGDWKLGNRLAEVADRYLGIELRKDPGRSDWGALMLPAEQIQYAAQDVEHLHALKEKLDAELKAAALMGVLRLEMDLLPVVVGMELIGFCVDRKKLEELTAEATQERDQVAQTVNNLLRTRDVNLNAPAQLLKALQGLGISLKNTNERSLSSRVDGRCHHEKMKPRERKSKPEQNLSTDRGAYLQSGLDIETKKFSATGRRRSFFVDIPLYRTTYLNSRSVVISGFLDIYPRKRAIASDLTPWRRSAAVPRRFHRDVLPGGNGRN